MRWTFWCAGYYASYFELNVVLNAQVSTQILEILDSALVLGVSASSDEYQLNLRIIKKNCAENDILRCDWWLSYYFAKYWLIDNLPQFKHGSDLQSVIFLRPELPDGDDLDEAALILHQLFRLSRDLGKL